MALGALVPTGCGDMGDAAHPVLGKRPASLEVAGDSLYQQGDFEEARTEYEGALEGARRGSDSVAVARILTSLGLAAWRLGDYPLTRRHGEEALALKRRLGLDDLLFRSYNALGLLAWSEGRFFDATERYEAAFAVAESRGDSADLAKASNNLGLVLTDIGEFDQARRYFTEALAGARSVADTTIQGRALNNLGMLEHQVGNPRRAIRHLEQARRLYAAVEDVTGDQNALAQLGLAYDALGSPGEALTYLDSALTLSRRHGLRQDEASNLELMAGVYAEVGDAPRSLRLLEDAREIDAELGLEFEAGVVLRRQAAIHAKLGAFGRASRAASEALALHRSIGATREELSDLILLAELAEEVGDPAAANRHMAAAYNLAGESGSRNARVEIGLARARLADARGDWKRLLTSLDAIVEDVRQAGYGDEWEAAALRARAYARLGSPQRAVEAGRRAVRAAERVRGGYGSSVLRTSFLAERQGTYFDLVTTLLVLGHEEEAFQVADRARGRALLEHLSAARTNGGGGEAVRALAAGERLLLQIDTLVVRLDELREYPPEEEGAKRERRMAAELERKRSDYEAFLAQAAATDPGAALLSGRGAELTAIVEALEPDEALLQYLVGEDRVLLFVATGDGLRTFETAVDRESLIGRIRLVRDLMSRPGEERSSDGPMPGNLDGDPSAGTTSGRDSGSSLTRMLERLHELLIAPALQDGLLAEKTRLIIVPHAELSYLPFSALTDPSTARYLAQDFALVHLPSSAGLPVLRADGRKRASASQGRPVAYAPFPERLPATVGEARAFEQALGRARVRIGRRATEARLRKSLASAPIVHLATHGVLNSRNPMFTRIEMARGSQADDPADDGRFELHELLAVPVVSSLVFLSGCETGLGTAGSTDFAIGEDYATLAQAFLYAGAGSVVATLWRIEDDGAAVFARHFYEALRTLVPSEALAEAQRAMLKDPRFHAPFYWAAYRLSGG